MSREIKFRAWVNGFLPEQSGMFYGVDLLRSTVSDGYDRINVWRNNNNYKFKSEEEPFELMQYTGLKDKNGTEIYEGDIVQEGKHHRYKIRWSESMAGFKKRHIIQYGKEPDELMNKSDTLEVIGNIYENPELLHNA